MKNTGLVLLAAVASSIVVSGCASNALDQKIDKEVTQETAIKTHADLQSESGQLIQSASGLTADQRAKLAALRDSTSVQVNALYTQSLKLRSVLIKDLVTASYDNFKEDEVELIKQRIKSIEDKRLTVAFDAIEQANTILGREALNNSALVEGFFEGHGGGRP